MMMMILTDGKGDLESIINQVLDEAHARPLRRYDRNGDLSFKTAELRWLERERHRSKDNPLLVHSGTKNLKKVICDAKWK